MGNKEAILKVRVTDNELARWREIARGQGLELSGWVRRSLNGKVDWWETLKDALHALRALNPEKMTSGLSVAEVRRRAKFIREQIELAERLADELEHVGAITRF